MPTEITVKVNGTAQDIMDDLFEVVVDSTLYMPSMCTVLIMDSIDELAYVDADTYFSLGATLEISLNAYLLDGTTGSATTIFKGEITDLEPIFSGDGGVMLRVRAYDKSHRLMRGKKSKVFANMKDSDIFSQVAGAAGLTAASDATTTTFTYLVQFNQTDWDFLWARARLNGYVMYLDMSSETLSYKKADPTIGSAITLTFNENLYSFHPRISLMNVVSQVDVDGWNPDTQTATTSSATSDGTSGAASIGLGQTGLASLSSKFSAATYHKIDKRPFDTSHAQKIAEGILGRSESQFIQAEGICLPGDETLTAGKKVTIQGVGTRYSGTYFVSEARHIWKQGGYQVEFSITGRYPYTLKSLLSDDTTAADGLINGLLPAKVTNQEDPDNYGRVKVKFPWLKDGSSIEIESDWARVIGPMAGTNKGMYYLPDVNDEVLVGFENGDPNLPYVIGGLWSKSVTPPTGTATIKQNGKVNQYVIRSRSGHLVILDDTQGSEQIIVQDKSQNNKIIIKTSDNSMALNADGNLTIKAGGDISIEATGAMTIKSQKDTTIQATGKGTLKATQDVSVESSGGQGNFKGVNVTVQATTSTAVKGLNVEVNGSANTAVKGGAMVQVQGALVKIN
jgi:uncharacterized protein involved in type VI secretion and phage assembly